MDSASGMRKVVVHLAGLGHKRCAYLAGPRNAWSNRERLRGLRAAVKSHGVELMELGPFEPKFEGGIQGTDFALETGATAIVAFNDMMALGVLSRLTARGISVPHDISVVGADDILDAAMCGPPLTTLAMPMELAGRTAVDLLLARQVSPAGSIHPASHRRLGTDLIVRGAGRRVVDYGMIPTDVLYFAVARDGLDGGMKTTASHNPIQYNGLKIVAREAFR